MEAALGRSPPEPGGATTVPQGMTGALYLRPALIEQTVSAD
jgi:hypothetical protein